MIYVECKPDEVLVRVLTGLPRREVIHEIKGKPRIVDKISKLQNSTGLIDEDPGGVQPVYLKRMGVVQDLLQRGLRILQDTKENRIIVICPRLEEWVVRAAMEARVDLRQYTLPDDPQRLHQVINDDLRKFQRLVEDLKDTDRLRALGSVLG